MDRVFTTEAQSAQREGYFFDLSPRVLGQIKILSPAMRDGMSANHNKATDNLTGLVFRATLKFDKQVRQVLPEGLGLLTLSAFPDRVRKELTLCELCASVVSKNISATFGLPTGIFGVMCISAIRNNLARKIV